MPKSPIKKSLQEYISKIKRKPSSHFRIPSKSISLSTKRFIRGCKHPKTQSFAFENSPHGETESPIKNDEAATLEDVDRFLLENFKSLYMNDDDENVEIKSKPLNEPPRFINPPPDLCGSRHFFEPTKDVKRASATSSDDMGSRSSTTTTEKSSVSAAHAGTSMAQTDSRQVMGPEDFIALLTYSPSPYYDFKQSMQEMIDARLYYHGKVDWEFMEELLSCYMNLNDKRSHKYILRAFVDLVVALRENSGDVSRGSRRSPTNRRN